MVSTIVSRITVCTIGYNISVNWVAILNLSNQFPFMLAVYSVAKVVGIAVCFYGFYVAYSLIKKESKAPSKAKILIIVILIDAILSNLSPLLYGLPNNVSHELLAENMPAIVGSFLFCVVWYSYFTKSARVKNTFNNCQ